MQHPVQEQLEAALGGEWNLLGLRASGFCDTWQAQRDSDKLFVKSASGWGMAMLHAEAEGLRALRATGSIRTPKVVAWSQREGLCVLALQWLDLVPPDAGFGRRLGEALAALHAAPHEGFYGWVQANYLGATPQPNGPSAGIGTGEWAAFFANERLAAMRDRLQDRTLAHAVDEVIEALPRLLADHAPTPALIHGDLWQGNWGMLADGAPVIFDPAISYSDPEAELAMMDLFGPAPAGFAEGYEAAGGVRPDPQRKRLYQLYHLLNHAVLFGDPYWERALRRARSLA